MKPLHAVGITLTFVLLTSGCSAAAPSATAAPSAAASTAAAVGTTAPKPSPLGTANIRTGFTANGEYCFLYLAVKKGYFSSRGLDVKIDEGQNATQIFQQLGAGQDFMATSAVNTVPIIVGQGAPLKVVAVLEQDSPSGIVVHGNGPITTPAQFAGKSINTGPGDALTLLPPYLRANNVDPASVTINNTDHATKLQSFLAGKGDAATVFSANELPAVRKVDPQARWFPYSQVFSYYGLGLVVSDKTIAERPQAVQAAVDGVLESEKYALNNPDECVDALVAAYPDRQFDKVVVKGQLLEHQRLFGSVPLGSMTDDRWKTLIDVLVKYFDLKTGARPMSDYYTNRFVLR